MTTRFSGKIFSFLAAAALVGTVACSKADQADTAATETNVEEKNVEPEEKPKDLEGAIAAPGPKTVTAHGASGETKVIAVGETTLAETDTYVVHATVPAGTKSGAEAVVSIRLTPKTGWKINQEFPTKLKVVVPDGVTMDKATLAATDAGTFSEKKAVFDLKVNSANAGAKDFTASFRFAVCTDATCDPKEAKLAWKLDVI